MALVILLLAAALLQPSNKEYGKEVRAIVKASCEDLQALQRKRLTPDTKVAATNLIIADGYLVLSELHRYEKHHSTRVKVDALVAQLSRDQETLDDLPELPLRNTSGDMTI